MTFRFHLSRVERSSKIFLFSSRTFCCWRENIPRLSRSRLFHRGPIKNMTIPIPDRRASDSELGEVSLANGFGSFISAAGSPWRSRVVSFEVISDLVPVTLRSTSGGFYEPWLCRGAFQPSFWLLF